MPSSQGHEDNLSNSLLSNSAQGATLLIGFQVGSRALTFLVNQILLRYLSPELLGISTQLELYSISVLYFARESLRVALQRQSQQAESISAQDEWGKPSKSHVASVSAATPAGQAQVAVNVSYIAILLGAPLAYVFALLYKRNAGTLVRSTPNFHLSLALYGCATFLELLAEPCFVTAQRKQLFKIRAAAETYATVARCVSTCATAIWASRAGINLGVLPFALGQMSYAGVLTWIYLAKIRPIAAQCGFTLTPQALITRQPSQFLMSYFFRPMIALSVNLYVQSAVKHVLTQGDSLLIATLASLQDQGAYALASNYGGLVARMLFQPIEESSRNAFGSLLSPEAGGKPSVQGMRSARVYLRTILRVYALLSVLAAALGPTIAPLLLRVVAGSRWLSTGAGDVLATYCYLIPLLALNGITEAFISSVASSTELQRQSVWMFAFSVGFASAGYIFLRVLGWGAVGLVWANVVNMLLRIVWSWSFIKHYLHRNAGSLEISDTLPSIGTLGVGLAAAALLARVRGTFTGGFEDLLKSGVLAVLCLILIMLCERDYLVACYHMLQSGRKSIRKRS